MNKKLLGLSCLALMSAFTFTGCSCSNTGTYKLYSVTMVNEEYVCSTTDNTIAKTSCIAASEEIKLGVNDKMIIKSGNTETTYLYKVEDGKVYYRESKDDDWTKFGEIVDGNLKIGIYTYKK